MPRTIPDAYAVGVDVGRTRDRSAVVVLHRHGSTGEVFVRYAQFRAGMSLEELEAAALAVLVSLDRQIPRDAKLMLVIDRNGIGMGPAESIHRKVMKDKSLGLRHYVKVIGVDATAGTGTHRDEKVNWWWNVGRDLLTHRANAALRDGTLNIREAEGNGAEALGTEVSRLHLKVTPSGRQRVDHKDGEHDDLYMAMCLGFWLLGQFKVGGHAGGLHPLQARDSGPSMWDAFTGSGRPAGAGRPAPAAAADDDPTHESHPTTLAVPEQRTAPARRDESGRSSAPMSEADMVSLPPRRRKIEQMRAAGGRSAANPMSRRLGSGGGRSSLPLPHAGRRDLY